MRISQKEFVRAMVENPTIFAGRAKTLYNEDEAFCKIADDVRSIIDGTLIVNVRNAVAYSKHIEFTGGSRLDMERSLCYKYEYPTFDLYINSAFSKGDSEPWVNMYYVVIR